MMWTNTKYMPITAMGTSQRELVGTITPYRNDHYSIANQ